MRLCKRPEVTQESQTPKMVTKWRNAAEWVPKDVAMLSPCLPPEGAIFPALGAETSKSPLTGPGLQYWNLKSSKYGPEGDSKPLGRKPDKRRCRGPS